VTRGCTASSEVVKEGSAAASWEDSEVCQVRLVEGRADNTLGSVAISGVVSGAVINMGSVVLGWEDSNFEVCSVAGFEVATGVMGVLSVVVISMGSALGLEDSNSEVGSVEVRADVILGSAEVWGGVSGLAVMLAGSPGETVVGASGGLFKLFFFCNLNKRAFWLFVLQLNIDQYLPSNWLSSLLTSHDVICFVFDDGCALGTVSESTLRLFWDDSFRFRGDFRLFEAISEVDGIDLKKESIV